MSNRRSLSSKTPSFWQQLSGLIRHPQESLLLCIVSALDVVMTIHLLKRGDINFTESNPFARYFLDRWGLEGMGYFKAVMTAVVLVITQIVARKNSDLARQVLGLASVIIVGVVIYSVWLHFKHRHIVEVLEVPLFEGVWL